MEGSGNGGYTIGCRYSLCIGFHDSGWNCYYYYDNFIFGNRIMIHNIRQILDQQQHQLAACLREYNESASRITDDKELLALRRHQNLVLKDYLFTHHRIMQVLAGETPDPVQHFAEGILLPSFGSG